jgi:intein/homing endonuclease
MSLFKREPNKPTFILVQDIYKGQVEYCIKKLNNDGKYLYLAGSFSSDMEEAKSNFDKVIHEYTAKPTELIIKQSNF